MENLKVEQLKKELMDFSKWGCTEDWWIKGGKRDAIEHINIYIKELRATGKIA